MNRFSLFLFTIIWGCQFTTANDIDFVRDIRPIFSEHCYDCHGEDKQKSGLRLDVKTAAFTGGDNHGPDIVPGKPEESPLIQFLISEDEDTRMPPKGARLSKKEIDTLSRWIKEGAHWPDGVDLVELEDTSDHWSFKPLHVRPGTHTIDSFIEARLAKHGMQLSPPADRRTWLRRVTIDLTGLPPTPDEMNDFLEDNSPDPHTRVVERLLASPHYGERWAQHWLDVARYADTHGFEVNTERAYAWPYRDYVIDAFNNNTPWDQFIREQLAGDATGKTEATGFLVTAAALLPGQIGKDEESIRLARQDELGEIVINTGEAFLGLSIGCARCHNHKFDPIPARDYYSMQAFFAGVRYGDRPVETPEVAAIVSDLKKRLLPLDLEIGKYVVEAGSGPTRAPVSARANIERFPPVKATKVRFTVHSTISNNLRQPYIDELEVFDVAGTNLSLEAKVVSAGNNKDAINDGIYGNKSCWKSRQKGGGSVKLNLARPAKINQIIWGRDRTGQYGDRLAETYTFDVLLENGEWKTVAGASDRAAFNPKRAKAQLFQKEDILPAHRARSRELVAARTPLLNELKQYDGGRKLVFAAQSHDPEPMHLLNRGDPEQPKGEVAPATLSFLDPVELARESTDLERRKALADWIASPENPLTARVIVNRIWQWHFGIGLVKTPNDFGNLGVPPTHPELLDWLAAEFIRSGWSVKDLHRKIILSATYRQSHQIYTNADESLLWRFPSRRVEAEVIRDSIFAISGQLNKKMFGRGYDLFHSRGGTGGFRPIESHLKPEGRRRMIYAYKVRMEREAVFGAFDCPDAGQSAPKRSQSTTPIQALNLFNSQFTIDLAADFAKRIQSDVGDSTSAQIQRAWNLALNREPSPDEIEDAESVVREHGLPTLCRVIFNTNEFLFLP
ncbi:MAG: PSD1 and planctomycete cytochrome C domain-containing protein [Verrucomicrobiales bacterium]|nr:PSD1 and planctomycete cytochrome C domain-containing protein [Verrucomicrobiales bacterium]